MAGQAGCLAGWASGPGMVRQHTAPMQPPLPRLQVTKKKVAGEEEEESHWDDFKRALGVTWPHLLYYVGLAAGTVYFIVRASLGYYR